MLEFHRNGRKLTLNQFIEGVQRDVIEAGMNEIEKRVRGVASSIVDPETGKHADVFVRRNGEKELMLTTSGSQVFARELERRLGFDPGSIETASNETLGKPRVYLAHASEDKETLARPLAHLLMKEGIEVWFDEWEIRAGDSLRRKMEEGLDKCTHFLVALTPVSVTKAWVQTEIDVGFLNAIEGKAKFIGIRSGLQIGDLSPFLRTLFCPELRINDPDDISKLIADIHGVSRKPALGAGPKYAQTIPLGLERWSRSAIAVAEQFVRGSKFGLNMDPQVKVSELAKITGLPEDDISLGILDLEESGLIESDQCIGDDNWFWPKIGLFVEFDRQFLGFDTRADAVAIATWLVNQKIDGIEIDQLATHFPDWTPRRINSALNFLDEAEHIQSYAYLGTRQWTISELHVTDRTRRFVRDHM